MCIFVYSSLHARNIIFYLKLDDGEVFFFKLISIRHIAYDDEKFTGRHPVLIFSEKCNETDLSGMYTRALFFDVLRVSSRRREIAV